MIFLVLPAYNESANLGRLLVRVQDVQALVPVEIRVIVIDDGSTDDTADVARAFPGSLGVEVVTHPQNSGLAAAIKTGLETGLSRSNDESDLIITMDADDTHPPALFPRMLARVREGYDLVVASRFTPGARVRGLTPARKLYSMVASRVFRVVVPIEGIRDYTCGYRAYRSGFLRQVWNRYGSGITTESGFACMADILLKCAEFEPIAVELPLILRYDRKEGDSKMRVARNIKDTLRLLLRAFLFRMQRMFRQPE